MGLSFEALHESAPAPDRLRHLRLWRRRPVSRQEGLRPADPERVRVPVDHRHARRAGQGRLLDRRHRRRHVRVQQHPRRADRARQDRPGQAHRRVDAREHGRVDELSAVLRLRRRGAAAAQRREPRDDLSLRAVPRRRRQDGDARPAERARVGGLLPPRARAAGARDRPALRLERARTAARDELRAIIVDGLRDAHCHRGRATPRRGADRQRPRQRRWATSGRIRSSKRAGAGSTSRRPPARCLRCCRRRATKVRLEVPAGRPGAGAGLVRRRAAGSPRRAADGAGRVTRQPIKQEIPR